MFVPCNPFKYNEFFVCPTLRGHQDAQEPLSLTEETKTKNGSKYKKSLSKNDTTFHLHLHHESSRETEDNGV